MNINKTNYITIVNIIIFCILFIVFVYYLWHFQIKEGLENQGNAKETHIKREDGKVVKRKKNKTVERFKESINWDPLNVGGKVKKAGDDMKQGIEQVGRDAKDGLNKIKETFDKVRETFDKMKEGFNMIGDFFKKIGNVFKEVGNFFSRVFNNIKLSFEYLKDIFEWIGSYLTCGVKFITNLNKCFGWYSLDTVGQILYSPIKFISWLFSLEYIENMLWEYIELLDCWVKKITGYHLVHYSDEINSKCYACCPKPFPRFPDLDWGFNVNF